MSTTNRTRPICKPVYFTEDEWLSVATKMAESDMPNFSAFCREMLLTGKVKHYDFSVIKLDMNFDYLFRSSYMPV